MSIYSFGDVAYYVKNEIEKQRQNNPEFKKAIGKNVSEAYLGADLILVLNNEEDIFNLKPNQDQIKELPGLCLHVTAKSKKI